MNRVIAVGDIHGCLNQLERLLCIINPKVDDQIIFLGDYISRGKDSFGVINFLIGLSARLPNIIFLKGNHEEMFLNYLSGYERSKFLFNNGSNVLREYTVDGIVQIPDSHIKFLNGLKLYFQNEDYFFVHAGVMPEKKLTENKKEDLLWIRNVFIDSEYKWPKKIVFGHTVFPEPLIMNNKIGIDTGAFCGGKLTAYDVSFDRFYQI